ncbi:MAG: RNA polymerase sigma factor [Bacteroidota bacterium]
MNTQELLPHLFRTEYSKITAVLCKHFGLTHIEVAEDIASDTFACAAETWPYKGIPENPTAWLYTVAKNRVKNYLARNKVFQEKVAGQWLQEKNVFNPADIDLSDSNISDSQLKMLFAVCHPRLPREAQVGLALRILCGFGIDEIATAFLTSKDTINKRLLRAKEVLRSEQVLLEFPSSAHINERLDAVLTTLYLLFNEGYYSESNEAVLREDLCLEAMRLTYLLLENPQTNVPGVNALLALMCFHASRFAARRNAGGELILYHDQDEQLWDRSLIARGVSFSKKAAQGNELTRYHIEASIAYWHTVKEDSTEKWESILHLYNQLLYIEYSPVAALNRTYAVSKVKGVEVAIAEAEKLQLEDNPYYFALLGELYKSVDRQNALQHFERARLLAKTTTDRQLMEQKIQMLAAAQ